MSEPAIYDPNKDDSRASTLITMTTKELLSIIIAGAVVGVIVAGMYMLLNHFVFSAVLCRPQSPQNCAQAPEYSMIVAQIIGIIAGVGALVRLRTYRPLLVVLASLLALWNLQQLIGSVAWYSALLASTVLFGLSYALFSWLARIRSFVLSLIVTIVVIVLVRFAFM